VFGSHALSLTDAFRRFNVSGTGRMNCTELFSGAQWLGLSLSVEQTHDMVRAVDSDHDGLLTLRDWRAALGQSDAANKEQQATVPRSQQKLLDIVPQIACPELSVRSA
jgi:hypothetical protein